MHVWLEVSSTGGALGPRRSTRQHFLRSAWRLLQRGSRVWCWEQRCDRHKFLTFAIGRAFRKELMLVFSKRLSTVALFQVLNNLDSVQNYVSPANVTLVICQPDELSAELSVKPLVFGETEFMLASNVIFQLTEEHCLVTIATEGLNSILHIVAVVFMHLIVSPLACFLHFWRLSFVGLEVHDKELKLSFFNLRGNTTDLTLLMKLVMSPRWTNSCVFTKRDLDAQLQRQVECVAPFSTQGPLWRPCNASSWGQMRNGHILWSRQSPISRKLEVIWIIYSTWPVPW